MQTEMQTILTHCFSTSLKYIFFQLVSNDAPDFWTGLKGVPINICVIVTISPAI